MTKKGNSVLAKLSSHETVDLPLDLEPPERFAQGKHLFATRMARWMSNAGERLALKLNGGVGIWNQTGKLLHFIDKAADIQFLEHKNVVLILENRFAHEEGQQAVRHALVIADPSTMTSIGEMMIAVPTGGVEHLVLNGQRDRALLTWLDQRQWGFVEVALLDKFVQTPTQFSFETATISPPAYSPDGSHIASCNFFRSMWWADEPCDWYDPSPGGERKVASIAITNTSCETSHHELMVSVPAEWLPDDPEDPDWNMCWGPEWVDDRSFRIWLPDNTEVILSLPLPRTVVVGRPLLINRHKATPLLG